MKLQVTESVQNLALYLVQVFCYFLKFFKVCRMFKKVAEHRFKVKPLAKTSVATSFQSSDGWMFEKTVKWSVGEGRRHQYYTQSFIQDTMYKPSTTRIHKAPILGC